MKYFALLTTYGEKVLAEATALGTKIELTHMSVGDGGGSLPAPDTKQTKLINERRKAAINTLFIDPLNPNQIIAEQVIPENEGGWWIREIGLFDKSGALVAIANCPETYKPLLVEGSGRTQTIRVVLIVSHTESVTLKIDPTVVLATRKYVDDAIEVLDKRIGSLTASDVGAVPVTRKVNGKPLSTDITLNSGDVGSYTKVETDTKVADAKKAGTDAQATANAANTAATNANNNANGRVPSTRKVNNKPLSTDISLTAGDVGAYTKSETDTKVADAKKAGTDAQATANAANTAATNANNNANGRVPSTRKVNNKPLSADISLTAGDVGAYTKAETDTKVADAKKAGTDAQATANAANTAATNANNNANGRVPSGRKVNGKPLTADITLSAGDVGGMTQQQGDARYEPRGNIGLFALKVVYSGSPMGDGQAISLPADYRGCWFYCEDKDGMPSTPAFIPDDNILIAANSGASGYLRIRLEGGGKTLRCVYSANGGAPRKVTVRARV
ncbi:MULTISPECIES: phage tail protein [Providencia]|uniref:phage tail protein n=1 Tax=Providencia TaxID=586 RepID=UPI002480D8AA|nr:phage tail protein [Providencia rettgeri]MDU7494285.1 phage tail protein [Providencia rettgeri]